MKTFSKIIDLTHSIDSSVPSWDGSVCFKSEVKIDYSDCDTETQFRVQSITMQAGCGTHIDAPAHCIAGGLTVEQLSLQNLFVPCVVLDVSERSHESYTVSLEDLEMFERKHGVIKKGQFFLIRTGWDRFWNDQERYRNNHLFPAVDSEVAQLLVARDIAGLGIDTLSPDRPESGFPVHKILLGAGKYIVENVANSLVLPVCGSYVSIMPLKGGGLTEAPVRMIGLVDR